MSKSRNNSAVGPIDWPIIGVWIFFVIFGWMTIYSAAYDAAHPMPFDFAKEYGKQMMWIAISVLLAILTLYIEGDFFAKFAWVIYGFFLMLLVLVLIIGKEVNGAKAWFGVGSFGIQPSEFSKIGVGLVLAKYIASIGGGQLKNMQSRMVSAAIIGMPAALILLQPDVGSLLTFVAFVFVMYREGLSGNVLIVGFAAILFGVLSIVTGAGTADIPFWGEQSGVWMLIIVLVILALLVLVYARNFIPPRNRRKMYLIVIIGTIAASSFSYSVSYIVDNILEKHHKERIYVMLSLPVERKDADYNAEMAKITVGMGGVMGKGWLDGPMTQNNYVPEQWTDFIFSAVAEEWGFLGSLILIGAYVFLIIRLMFIADRQRSVFSRVYGYCVACIFFMHFLINIGMVIGLAPIIGIPLPFFSYGGSSLMAFTLLLFIMVRLDSERWSVLK
jgi:rod shape determining protein RodA